MPSIDSEMLIYMKNLENENFMFPFWILFDIVFPPMIFLLTLKKFHLFWNDIFHLTLNVFNHFMN